MFAYVAICGAMILGLMVGYGELSGKIDALSQLQEQLTRLQDLKARQLPPSTVADEPPPGSVYLGGDKSSIAAAEFQRRVTLGISGAGGTVLSSQLDRQEASDPNVAAMNLTVECEIEQEALTPIIHEFETQTPFLFVEGLSIRLRTDAASQDRPQRLRVSFRLVGYWREAAR